MRGLRRGIVSLALAGALATGGFIGGMMLSGGAATAATGGTTTALTGTAVAATASPSTTPKSNESAAHEKQETTAQEQAENSGTARHNCPRPSSRTSATGTSSNV
ncbi:MAG: hypothetical protein E6G04_05330 [Actinobacteria bacterium]|nr:MAG: hypothetical protein E6G04_05330 [Actinomycetota bacterium]